MNTAQRRTLTLLCIGQVLGGLSMGATLALGAILGERLSGSESYAGLPTTVLTLGAAAAGLPLAALAQRSGRRIALSTGLLIAAAGSSIVVVAVDRESFVLMLVGMVGVGAGTAVGLQSRFAATDLSAPDTRGRDLSLVVWMTMVGSVTSPALVPAGTRLAESLGLAPLSGPFLLGAAASAAAAVVLFAGLRPDPLLLAAQQQATESVTAPPAASFVDGVAAIRASTGATQALAAVISAHAVMVAVMALTPVHMSHHGATLSIVGLSISAHIAGMYLLAPVMGVLTDRIGRLPMIAAGQVVLILSCLLGFAAGASGSQLGLVFALVLLGLGWSAATVAAAALLTDSIEVPLRARVQGISDTAMSLAGAVAGALAGVVVGLFGYVTLVLLAAVIGVAMLFYLAAGRRRLTTGGPKG